ncbi:MAG: MBL fold metallo-hydrolase [Gammaproteobacteria bacterium]|nr:MBL fold metallo-hydrolase [Gammaproteobacteria bacterium]
MTAPIIRTKLGEVMKTLITIMFGLMIFGQSQANDRFADTVLKAVNVSDNVYIIYGAGGNIGALVGEEGILIIDDQFEPLAPKIEQAVFELANTKQKVSYVVNTHYHGDHTGSNVYFSKSASILAHENVRKRLSVKSKEGLPVITYQQGVKLHLNEQTVHVRHLSSGHTDGDSVVFFQQANVWHLGDLFFNMRFPYVDKKSGGTVEGLVKNLKQLLKEISDDAAIIPGHGELTDKRGLQTHLDMILATKSEVDELKAQGLSLEQAIEKGLSDKWKEWHWNFITEERWITTLYEP